ncbi:DUF2079 domain-containing protein [Streptomyces sp. NBC_01537]|uniref:DUF2079 domain-containing protein n=1 Tax=Streptomyces sp. NBC_01537 TaxID=2903896 RepID=UPI00386B9088
MGAGPTTEQQQRLVDLTSESLRTRTRVRRRRRIRTVALILICFASMLSVGLQQWADARLGGFDLGIFDQAIREYAHFHLPRSPIKNFHHEFPPAFSLLGDHFSPVLALLAPLYWIWDDPRVLLIAQAALFAAGVPLVRRITTRCFADAAPEASRTATDLAGLVYALGWPLFMASREGFHEVAFAVPLTLLMLERGQARRYGGVIIAAVLLLCTKEDLGLLVAAYGLVLALRSGGQEGGRRGIWTGLCLLVIGPAGCLAAIRWLIPAMGGEPGYYWNYGKLGPGVLAVGVRLLTDPVTSFSLAVDSWAKVSLLLWLFLPLLFLPFGSATVLCALPLLAERLFSDNPSHWSMSHHYDAFLWPLLLVATIETLARLHLRAPGRARRWVTLSVTACLALGFAFGLARLADPAHWRPTAPEQALVEAAARIPDGVTVEADNNAAPHLTARTHTVIADDTPRGADYVLLQTSRRTFPFRSAAQEEARVRLLLAHGYEELWARDGVVLLVRMDDEAIPGMRIPGEDSIPVKDAPL